MSSQTVAAVSKACRLSIEKGDARFASNLPDILYHLTDTNGFVGIVSSRRLWANLATSSNDASELRHGMSVAVSVLRERLEIARSAFDEATLEYLLDPSRAVPRNVELFPLVISFCGHCRKSGQWLHYGRSGRGVALGFARAIADSVKMDLSRVDYDPASQRSRIADLFDVAGSALGPRPTPEQIHDGAGVASMYVSWLALRMKDPSFSEEDEWRLSGQVVFVDGKVQDNTVLKYRESGERLIPYEERDFAKAELLQDVVVGYSSLLTPDAARLILLNHGFTTVVRRSTVPVQ